jgi:hypothetical protein
MSCLSAHALPHTLQQSSSSRRQLSTTQCIGLDPRRHGSARTCRLHSTLTPAACAARSARSAPGRDTRSGQGALARRHTDGPLWAALLKTTVMCEAWRPRTIAPWILLELVQLLATSASPSAKSLIPIPVPVQYRLSRVKAYSGGVLARALPEGLRYLST